jgi:hypothetical protein
MAAEFYGHVGRVPAAGVPLGKNFPIRKGKMASVHRKAPCPMVLLANKNLSNNPCDATCFTQWGVSELNLPSH